MKKNASNLIDKTKKYSFDHSVNILKNISSKKFEETVEASIQFNVVPKKNIVIKGYSVLNHNIGKKYKPAILEKDNLNLFDDVVLLSDDDLKNLNKKNINFDIILTTPTNIVKFSKLGKLLNGKKIMPDIKYGTVSTDLNMSLNHIKGNYVRFKIDKNYCLNIIVGKIGLSVESLKENIEQLILDVKKYKPQNCKSVTVKSLVISSTMGPGIKIDLDSINC